MEQGGTATKYIESDMDALSNARITVENSGKSLKSFTPPTATNSNTGVSVEFVSDANKRWFVLRASYGRCRKVADMLIEAGYYVYFAQRYEYSKENGRTYKKIKDLIPNILFVYIEKDAITSLLSRSIDKPSPIPELAVITTFYYNHFSENNGKNPPLEIPNKQMLGFIELTASKDENIVYVSDSKIVHIKKDDFVLVNDGKFKGCMGKVVRIAGQQRVGLQLSGLGWVATSYIPTAFLEVIPEEIYKTYNEDLY